MLGATTFAITAYGSESWAMTKRDENKGGCILLESAAGSVDSDRRTNRRVLDKNGERVGRCKYARVFHAVRNTDGISHTLVHAKI